MAVFNYQFTQVLGVMTEDEYKRFLFEVDFAEKFSGTASLTIAVQPGGWAKSSSGFIQNDTNELLEQEIEVDVVNGILDLQFGCHGYSPIAISGYFTISSFTQAADTAIILYDNFESALDITYDEYDWIIKTPLMDWRFICDPIEEDISEDTSVTLDNGFEITLSESLMSSTRGITLLPIQYWEEELLSETTNITLEIDTNYVSSNDLGEYKLPVYGIWVVGTVDAQTSLWIDLRPASFFEVDEALIVYPEYSGWYSESSYEYITLGEGKHTIDISQFDEYLGGGVTSIMFASYLTVVAW